MTDVMNALYLKNCSHLNRHFYMIRAYTICKFSQLYQVLHQNNETYDLMIFQRFGFYIQYERTEGNFCIPKSMSGIINDASQILCCDRSQNTLEMASQPRHGDQHVVHVCLFLCLADGDHFKLVTMK